MPREPRARLRGSSPASSPARSCNAVPSTSASMTVRIRTSPGRQSTQCRRRSGSRRTRCGRDPTAGKAIRGSTRRPWQAPMSSSTAASVAREPLALERRSLAVSSRLIGCGSLGSDRAWFIDSLVGLAIELEGFALLLGGRASPPKCPGPVPPVLGCECGCRCGGLACAGDHLLRCVDQSAASRVGERNDPVRLDSVSGSQARPGADPGDWWTRLAELAEGREITSSARPPAKI
jgi:hypothetical protein